MAVLVEGISVIVRRDAIEEKIRGGLSAFLATVPNGTCCMDADLVRGDSWLPRTPTSICVG